MTLPAPLKLLRLYYGVPMAGTFLLTVYYARGGWLAWGSDGLATVGLLAVIAGAYALNDAIDAHVDARNVPTRPIPAGQIGRLLAGAIGAVCMLAGVVVGWFVSVRFATALSAVAAGLVAYDVYSKRLGSAKQLVVAALMTSIYPLAIAQAGGALGPRRWALLPFAAWMFVSSFAYETFKDLRDRRGDRATDAPPNSLQAHPLLWKQAGEAGITLGAALLIAPAFLGCRWLYAAGIVGMIAAAGWAVQARSLGRKLLAIYVEFVIVGVFALVDPVVLGF
jgi:geranylgeranylglycerol-phosphate geranylgeranyltransferase